MKKIILILILNICLLPIELSNLSIKKADTINYAQGCVTKEIKFPSKPLDIKETIVVKYSKPSVTVLAKGKNFYALKNCS